MPQKPLPNFKAMLVVLLISTVLQPACVFSQKIETSDAGLKNTNRKVPEFQLKGTVIRWIFQDSGGTYWFGTNGRGVIRLEGNTPKYFNRKEGFASWAVRGIVEDKNGQLWFATSGGISKYDGKQFTNYHKSDGLPDDDVAPGATRLVATPFNERGISISLARMLCRQVSACTSCSKKLPALWWASCFIKRYFV